MARFPVLKHVFLNFAAVCNSQSSVTDDDKLLTGLLPPHIESLCLAGEVGDAVIKARMAKALVHLAKTVKDGEQFTALKRVRCDVEMDGDGVLEVGYRVSEAFEFAGVVFAYDSWEASCGPTLGFGEGTLDTLEWVMESEGEDYGPIPDNDFDYLDLGA
jgi:hypothetical protein